MQLTAEQYQAISQAFEYGFGTVVFFAVVGVVLGEILNLIKR